MIRVLKPLPGKKDAIRRPPSGDDGTLGQAAPRPHLSIVRVTVPLPAVHRGMWHGDPAHDPAMHTSLEDWPQDAEFDPLIVGARAAGDHALLALLEADRAYCAEARLRLSRPQMLGRDGTA